MKRAVVIGAGVGGSAAAALLAQEGCSVTVLERNAFVGGRAAGYEREGFTVDCGVHGSARGSRGPLGEVARRTGAGLEFVQPRSALRIMTPKRSYDISANASSLAALIKLFPVTRISLRNLPGAARVFSRILKIRTVEDAGRYDGITLREFLSRYTDDEGFHGLCDLICGLMLVVGADEASAGEFMWSLASAMRDGSMGYPRGAFGRISRSYLDACERKGGRVLLGVEAVSIRVEDGKVTGVEADGTIYPADLVVSNAGIRNTVEMAGKNNFSRDYLKRMESLKYSEGGVTLKLALDRRPFDIPAVFFLPDNLNIGKNMYEMAGGRIPEDLPIFMPCPTNLDPSLAPPGRHLLLAGTMVPAGMPEGADEKILNVIERRIYALFPGIKERVLWKHRTDLDYVNMLGGRREGDVVGLAQTRDQVGKNKPDARTPVEGLFLVGCDAGGRGIGTEQAADSALKVSEMIAASCSGIVTE